MPFKSDSILGLYDRICEDPLEFPQNVFVSDSLKHLLDGLLKKDSASRMTLDAAMCHPWVTYNGELPVLPQTLVGPLTKLYNTQVIV